MPERIAIWTRDLIDTSQLKALIPQLETANNIEAVITAAIIIINLEEFGPIITEIRSRAPAAFIIAYGPHVDIESAEAARVAGADRVLPRSRFFRDPLSAISRPA